MYILHISQILPFIQGALQTQINFADTLKLASFILLVGGIYLYDKFISEH